MTLAGPFEQLAASLADFLTRNGAITRRPTREEAHQWYLNEQERI